MLFRHEHDKPLSEDKLENLASTGEKTQGTVMHNEPSAQDRTRCQVRVEVFFNDGEKGEFTEELASLYQPAPGSPDALRLTDARKSQDLHHPERVPKMQLSLSAGERIVVRYDARNRHRLLIDRPALQKKAVHDYIESLSFQRKREAAVADKSPVAAGPPWEVPATCPNCGAPVDQAKASKDPDPMCRFCEQPIPVKPLARS
jgi:hypothetical protein